MAVAYYFDESVNRAICLGLRLRGVEVMTAQEDGRRATDDEEILTRATLLNRPLVTADQDFLAIAKARLEQSKPFSGVNFLSFQVSVGYAIENLEFYAKAGEPEDFINEVIFI
jgi:hypothetical protein